MKKTIHNAPYRLLLGSLLGLVLLISPVGAKEDDLINQLPVPQAQAVGPIIDSLQFNKLSISEALRMIAQKSGLKIQVPEGLTAPVTHSFKNMNALDALRIILEKNQLAYREEKGAVQVMTQSEYQAKTGKAFDQDIRTLILPLKNSSATELVPVVWNSPASGRLYVDEKANALILIDHPDKLAAMEKTVAPLDVPRREEVFEVDPAASQELSAKVQSILTPHVGKIKLNKRSNKMTVTETDSKIEEIKELLGAATKKDVHLALEARIVQVVLNDEHREGVDWEAIVSDYRSLKIGNHQPEATTDGAGTEVKLSIGTLSDDDYEILLEALDTVGETNVLPPAKMKAQDQEEIKLLIGAKETNILMTTTTPSSAPGANDHLNFIEVGMQLFVTPVLSYDEDSTVSLKIRPDATASTAANNTPSIETKIAIKKGSTVVIGGLIEDEKIETIKKIPLLGDIPFVGLAFRSQDKRVRKTEWILFLSPKLDLVPEGGQP